MTHHMSVDIETYSPEPIGKTGLYKYALSPDFEILLFGYSLDGAPVQVLDLTQPGAHIPGDVAGLLFNPSCVKHAYNAAFEWFCLSRYFHLEHPEDYLHQWRCTQLHGMYLGYPTTLDATGKALGLPEDKQKLATGRALIRYFCVPCRPTKSNGHRTRNLPKHDPDKWDLFIEYNKQDVVTEMAIDQRMSTFPVPPEVQKQWELDLQINLRGVAVDLDLIDGALWCGTAVREDLTAEAVEISGLDNPNSVVQLSKWLEKETGEAVADLRKDTVKDLLKTGVPSDKATRMLEIRQELGKTSNKKYTTMQTCVCPDSRIRGLMQFYGANRTGREAGRLVQVQNLPHDVVPAMPLARQLVKDRQLDTLKAIFGSVPVTLAALIRTALVAKPGCKFVDADFSAIEARVIAWLANEQWTLDVFKTTGKIYEATASQMFGIPAERIKKGNPEYAYRAKGKVATLALGYQGSTGALITMGALRMGLEEDELPDIVQRWRKANPHIVRFWYDIEHAANDAVTTGTTTQVGKVIISRQVDTGNDLDFMIITLPSGRRLYYPSPRIAKNRFGKDSLAYMGQIQATHKWGQIETYGGKLVENITQAVARDCLFFAMENLTAAGYHIVFDVHDEVVLEVPEDQADLDDVIRIMSAPPPWAPDLPLNADGWVDDYFKKD